MQVCRMASARAVIGGPGRVSRIAWSAALFHWRTTLPAWFPASPPARAASGRNSASAPAAAAVAATPTAARSRPRRV